MEQIVNICGQIIANIVSYFSFISISRWKKRTPEWTCHQCGKTYSKRIRRCPECQHWQPAVKYFFFIIGGIFLIFVAYIIYLLNPSPEERYQKKFEKYYYDAGKKSVEVPKLIDMTIELATATLENVDLKWKITNRERTIPEDKIIGQKPKVGETLIKEGNINTAERTKLDSWAVRWKLSKEIKEKIEKEVIKRSIVELTSATDTVPDVIGMTLEEARGTIAANELTVGTIVQEYNDSPEKTVIRQHPQAGTSVSRGSKVNLTIATKWPEVPNLIGRQLPEAEQIITATDWYCVGNITYQESDRPEGEVIFQNPPADTQHPQDTPINLVVSSPPPPVPNVVRRLLSEARQIINATNWYRVGNITHQESDRPEGEVISQKPPANTRHPQNTPINLWVSSGEIRVLVPDVIGMTLEEARGTITANRLTVGNITHQESDRPEGEVISQNPPANTRHPRNTPINLVVSSGEPPHPVPNVVGKPLSEARQIITDTHWYRIGNITYQESNRPEGEVISQTPAPDTRHPRNTPISLVISVPPPPPPPTPRTIESWIQIISSFNHGSYDGVIQTLENPSVIRHVYYWYYKGMSHYHKVSNRVNEILQIPGQTEQRQSLLEERDALINECRTAIDCLNEAWNNSEQLGTILYQGVQFPPRNNCLKMIKDERQKAQSLKDWLLNQ